MIIVRSTQTGQTLFVIGPSPTTAYMSAHDAREALRALANSPLGDHVDIIPPEGGAPISASKFKASASLLRQKARFQTV